MSKASYYNWISQSSVFVFQQRYRIAIFNFLLDLEFGIVSHTWFADPTDIYLRHSVANLVACALGAHTCEKSSHLWYLVFAPEALCGTYLAGYMVKDL